MMFSLNCPISPEYRTSVEQKRQSREAAKKRRGTPTALRDLLREKCRIRLQESRQDSFRRGRKFLDVINEDSAIDQILRRELADLEQDVELQEEIFKEVRAEANDWFAEQIEQEENYLIDVGESNVLCCPVCQKNILEYSSFERTYKCVCGISFLYTRKTADLGEKLSQKIAEHEENCIEKLIFYTEPFPYAEFDACACVHNNILSAICDCCDFFTSF